MAAVGVPRPTPQPSLPKTPQVVVQPARLARKRRERRPWTTLTGCPQRPSPTRPEHRTRRAHARTGRPCLASLALALLALAVLGLLAGGWRSGGMLISALAPPRCTTICPLLECGGGDGHSDSDSDSDNIVRQPPTPAQP